MNRVKSGLAFEKLSQKQCVEPYWRCRDRLVRSSVRLAMVCSCAGLVERVMLVQSSVVSRRVMLGLVHKGARRCVWRCGHLTMRSSGQRGQAVVFADVLSARCRLTRRYMARIAQGG